MRIHDLSIRNFRGIKELTNLKIGDINSFVGKNDSGKSNILKALELFFSEKLDTHDIYKGIQDGEKTEITIRFNPPFKINDLATDAEDKIHIKKTFEFSSSGRTKSEVFYVCNDIDDPSHQNVWGLKEADINKYCSELNIDYSKSGRGVTNLSKIELIDEDTRAIGRTEQTHDGSEYLKNITKQYDGLELPVFLLFDAEQDLDVSSTSFQKQFKPIANESLENNSDLTSKIEEHVQVDLETEFSTITTLMQKNVPDLEKINTSPYCNWGNLVKFDLSLKFKSDDFDIPISNKGTGFKRLLMVAYFEYLAQKNNTNHQIFGIEEPETFLHPELQQDLLTSIIELADESQFFLTTHSPVFAGSTKDSNIVVVKKEGELSRYYNHENEDDILDMVITELGIKPNYNLLHDNYRKAIFVEGSGDIKFWEIAIEKIAGELPEDLLFIPCGGDQVDFFVNAELCRKINRQFLVLLDSDKGAVDFKEKQANKESITDKVNELGGETYILRKREIENYYSPAAIQRLLGEENTLPADFEIDDYVDVKELIKTHIIENFGVNFKTKSNIEVFNEMTKEEWITSAVTLEEGTTDIEKIVSKIIE